MIAGIYGIFPTSDGWIAIVGVVGPQRPVFYEIIGRRELEADPRFATPLLTEEQKAELFPIIGDALRERTTSTWCEAFAAAAIRYAPVRDYAAVAADPQVWENGYLRTIEDDHGAEVQIVGSPITLSEHPAKLGGAVPELGQHTEEVLLELGYSWDDIGALRDAGAF